MYIFNFHYFTRLPLPPSYPSYPSTEALR